MKKIAPYLLFCLILGFSILLGSCGAPPQAEMEAAVDALTRAENDPDAAMYAESSLNRARTAVSQMNEAAQRKRYKEAKTFAGEAVSAAEQAIREGRAAGLRAREEAAALLAELKETLRETQTALNNAQTIPRVNLDLGDLNRKLDAAALTLIQAETDAAENRGQDALTKGRSVRSDLTAIQNTIAGGVRSVSRKQ